MSLVGSTDGRSADRQSQCQDGHQAGASAIANPCARTRPLAELGHARPCAILVLLRGAATNAAGSDQHAAAENRHGTLAGQRRSRGSRAGGRSDDPSGNLQRRHRVRAELRFQRVSFSRMAATARFGVTVCACPSYQPQLSAPHPDARPSHVLVGSSTDATWERRIADQAWRAYVLWKRRPAAA
jgi:hypothetical protein